MTQPITLRSIHDLSQAIRERRKDLIGSDDLKVLAQETGVTFRFLRTRMQSMWEKIRTAMDQAKSDFEDQGFDGKLIQQVEQSLQKIHKGFAKRIGV